MNQIIKSYAQCPHVCLLYYYKILYDRLHSNSNSSTHIVDYTNWLGVEGVVRGWYGTPTIPHHRPLLSAAIIYFYYSLYIIYYYLLIYSYYTRYSITKTKTTTKKNHTTDAARVRSTTADYIYSEIVYDALLK